MAIRALAFGDDQLASTSWALMEHINHNCPPNIQLLYHNIYYCQYNN
jgi:hypothetical protein